MKSDTIGGSCPPLSQRLVTEFVKALQLWTDAPFVTMSLSNTINIFMDDADTEHTFHVDLRVADTFAWRSLQLQSRTISEENSFASDIASW